MGFSFLGFSCALGIFLGCVGSPGDFFGFCFLSSSDHPCHLKSELPCLGIRESPPPGHIYVWPGFHMIGTYDHSIVGGRGDRGV